MVRHLECRVQRRQIILPWLIYLDAMEGHLYQVAQEGLREAIGDRRDGGQV